MWPAVFKAPKGRMGLTTALLRGCSGASVTESNESKPPAQHWALNETAPSGGWLRESEWRNYLQSPKETMQDSRGKQSPAEGTRRGSHSPRNLPGSGATGAGAVTICKNLQLLSTCSSQGGSWGNKYHRGLLPSSRADPRRKPARQGSPREYRTCEPCGPEQGGQGGTMDLQGRLQQSTHVWSLACHLCHHTQPSHLPRIH